MTVVKTIWRKYGRQNESPNFFWEKTEKAMKLKSQQPQQQIFKKALVIALFLGLFGLSFPEAGVCQIPGAPSIMPGTEEPPGHADPNKVAPNPAAANKVVPTITVGQAKEFGQKVYRATKEVFASGVKRAADAVSGTAKQVFGDAMADMTKEVKRTWTIVVNTIETVPVDPVVTKTLPKKNSPEVGVVIDPEEAEFFAEGISDLYDRFTSAANPQVLVEGVNKGVDYLGEVVAQAGQGLADGLNLPADPRQDLQKLVAVLTYANNPALAARADPFRALNPELYYDTEDLTDKIEKSLGNQGFKPVVFEAYQVGRLGERFINPTALGFKQPNLERISQLDRLASLSEIRSGLDPTSSLSQAGLSDKLGPSLERLSGTSDRFNRLSKVSKLDQNLSQRFSVRIKPSLIRLSEVSEQRLTRSLAKLEPRELRARVQIKPKLIQFAEVPSRLERQSFRPKSLATDLSPRLIELAKMPSQEPAKFSFPRPEKALNFEIQPQFLGLSKLAKLAPVELNSRYFSLPEPSRSLVELARVSNNRRVLPSVNGRKLQPDFSLVSLIHGDYNRRIQTIKALELSGVDVSSLLLLGQRVDQPSLLSLTLESKYIDRDSEDILSTLLLNNNIMKRQLLIYNLR